ncbi:hypothetical protein PMG25_01700 [Roseofilum sp. BLCC_M114]|uniref:site-specific DNA-methyltransferase (adenine-specific) n=1 Tax=Roseofilum capinflatum BLCC-M114 TaxID=3022440 RepID=A0ABT7B0W2_9CYAN|nr:DNA methyltransferase [Roseofilum capinflatum]MDJ1172801.1 hypothetical protein [Roseofilum capinflatum BLCC-M114]
MKLNRKRTENYLKTFDFESLFIEELGWDTLDHLQIPLEVQEQIFPVETIAQKRGFTVYQCVSEIIPERKVQRQLDRQLTEYSQSHLLIFTDQAQTKQVWMWVKQEPGQTPKPRFHTYTVGKAAEALIQKLEALAVDISEEEDLTLVDVVQRVKSGFNIEQVTKQFFQDFEGLHQNFCLEIEGIEDSGDRRWYASVLLNRLMFVYFLQRRYFLDGGNSEYLQHKLAECQESDRPFYGFLKDLFFEGFAKLEADRHPEIRQRLGKICYLNGGLFLRHAIEQKYPQIEIKNQAFRHVLDLFSRYSWHLNDRPDAEKESNEINPDVLGYIFEKYINQKEFGAYYTRPQITEYLCDRTINKLILDRVNRRANQAFTGIEQLLEGLDDSLCHLLLKDILPQLSLLDPACGSGAFLVAAMKTLIPIYQQVINRVAHSTDEKLSVDSPKSPLKRETFANAPFFKGGWGDQNIPHNSENGHNSLEYYIKKRIITDNLYGVDIMEEATEIAKLRLFLALVASVERVEDLEPLPNVDFNIMAGNSLMGLIRVDGDAFNRLGADQKQTSAIEPTQLNLLGKTFIQGNLLNSLAASEYEKILAEKNKSIELYKKHAFLSDEQRDAEERSKDQSILALRNHIDEINRESQVKLNQILLDEFSTKLGIKYEEAQLQGKPKKRVLNRADIDALEPFHWGYHFDKVFARGGFDAIIANPPWEIFKPQAKEFFARYSALVTKNKMDIKTFEKEQEKLLQDPEVAAAWCEYKSQFPHVSLYYRSAQEYQNQISVVNGRKQGTDINLYKLFLERCFHLLRSGGECGIVIPSGIYTDLGTKQLRELLFSQTQVTGLFCFENRKEIFEGVHRSFKFVVLSFEKGGKTQSFPTRFTALCAVSVDSRKRSPLAPLKKGGIGKSPFLRGI